MWTWIAWTLGALNGIAFLAHGLDKWKAKRGSTRIRERTLLLLALPLAVPGAWLGMWAFRHKTRKSSFKWKLGLVTLIDVALVWGAWELSARAAGG